MASRSAFVSVFIFLFLSQQDLSEAADLTQVCLDASFWPLQAGRPIDPAIGNAFQQIGKVYPNFRSIKTAPETSPSGAQIPYASRCPDGDPILIFPKSFTEDIRRAEPGGDTYWKWVFIFAHEYSHVALNHETMLGTCRFYTDPSAACAVFMSPQFRRDLELEADFWAAYALAGLGATLDQTKAALSAMSQITPFGNAVYPDPDVRADKLVRAWDQVSSRFFSAGDEKSLDDFEVLSNTDLVGYELFSFSTPSINNCAATCSKKNASDCAAFSFDRFNRFCYLKRQLNASNAFSSKDEVLNFDISSDVGIRKTFGSPPAATSIPKYVKLTVEQAGKCDRFDSLSGMQFYDSTIKLRATPSEVRNCKERCRLNAECNAFQILNGVCAFFDKVGGIFPTGDPRDGIGFRRYRYDPACRPT